MVVDVWPGILSRKYFGLPGRKDIVNENLHHTNRERDTALGNTITVVFDLNFCLILNFSAHDIRGIIQRRTLLIFRASEPFMGLARAAFSSCESSLLLSCISKGSLSSAEALDLRACLELVFAFGAGSADVWVTIIFTVVRLMVVDEFGTERLRLDTV